MRISLLRASVKAAVLLACLAAAAMPSACSADPTPTAAPILTPVPAATPAAAPAAEPTTMPASTATPRPTAAVPTPTPTAEHSVASTSTPAGAPAPTATTPPTVGAGVSDETLVMLADPLDEPEFYCVDVAGFGANLNVNAPLQAHTCKPGADDEMFAFNRPAGGQLFLVEHDRCVEADGASLYVRPCSESPLQRFAYGGDGTLSTDDGGLCLAVAGGDGEPAGGRSHVRRDLLVRPCSEVEPALSQWLFPGPSPGL